MAFPLEEFDVIVGMDWLSRNKATIDCVAKKVALKGPKGVRVTYCGFVERPSFKLISTVTMKSFMRKRYPLILCHVHDLSVKPPKVEEVPIVQEFVDVFFQMRFRGYLQGGMWSLGLT